MSDERYGERGYEDLFRSLIEAVTACTILVLFFQQVSPAGKHFLYIIFYLVVFFAMLIIVHYYNHKMQRNLLSFVYTPKADDGITKMLSECRN